MWTVMTALILAQAAPAADAETLGLALARSGTLATMLPLIEAKETEEMIADHAELSDAEKAALRATAERVGRAGADRILTALGHAYAERLSIADLQALIDFNATPAAARYRDAAPAAVAEAMAAVGAVDFKGETLAAFCAETGKACPAED